MSTEEVKQVVEQPVAEGKEGDIASQEEKDALEKLK